MSFSRLFRKGLIALIISAGFGLAGCTFVPVYGEYGVAEQALAISYGEPGSRLDQIIYQELALRLGSSAAPDAPRVVVSARQSSRTLTRSKTADPMKAMELTVTAKVTVVRGGSVVFSGTRTASASYATSSQVIANKAAETEAAEQAARAVAESVRLALLAALAEPVAEPDTAAMQ